MWSSPEAAGAATLVGSGPAVLVGSDPMLAAPRRGREAARPAAARHDSQVGAQ